MINFAVRIECADRIRTVRAAARDAQEAQARAISFLEFNGVCHGSIVSIRRV